LTLGIAFDSDRVANAEVSLTHKLHVRNAYGADHIHLRLSWE